MNRIVVRSRVGDDGFVHVPVAINANDPNREVQVTIEPVETPSLTQEEWRRFVLDTAGSIQDPTFIRHEQGKVERREDML